jgi:hypothetical protein
VFGPLCEAAAGAGAFLSRKGRRAESSSQIRWKITRNGAARAELGKIKKRRRVSINLALQLACANQEIKGACACVCERAHS